MVALAATVSLVVASCGADTQQEIVVEPAPPTTAAPPEQVTVEPQAEPPAPPPSATERTSPDLDETRESPRATLDPAPPPATSEPSAAPESEPAPEPESEPSPEPSAAPESEPAPEPESEPSPEPPPESRTDPPPPEPASPPEPPEPPEAPGPPVDPEVAAPPAPPPPPPPPPPPATQPLPPPEVPSWSPVTVLVSKETVNGVIPVYDAPDGSRLSFRDGEVWSYTFRGNRLVVRVLQVWPGDEWAEVELPVRPNGSRGWVRTENFTWSTVQHHVLIDISDRLVALFDGDDLVTYTRAIVGRPNTPTPALRGFIVEKLPNHSQQNASVVLGDWILMLSFFSQALDTFSGGLPRIALHGTHIPGRVGEALSNGCIRIPNNIIEVIARTAPLGTVVNITA